MVRVVRHKTLEAVLDAYFKPRKRPNGGSWQWYDHRGKKNSMKWNIFIRTLRRRGMWAFVINKRVIHLWVDSRRVNLLELLRLFAHELGHLQAPYGVPGGKLEEKKAAKYDFVAETAFRMATDIMGRRTK